jgi:type I restriction enzyme S subunit
MTTNPIENLDLPENWKMQKFRHVTSRRKLRFTGSEELLSVYLQEGVIPFAHGGEDRVHNPAEDLTKYQQVRPGDLVMNNQQAWRGSVGVSAYSGIISPAYYIYEISQDLDPRYASYLFRSKPMVLQYDYVSGGVGNIQRNLDEIALKEIFVPIPPIADQKKTADFLDKQTATINSALNGKLKIQQLLNEASQAEFSKIFDHPYFSVESTNASRRLGPCLLANDGGVWGDEPVGSGDVLVLRSTEISRRGYWRDLVNGAYRNLDEIEARRSQLKLHDIVVTKASGSADHIGKAAIVTEEIQNLNASFGNFMQRIRVNPSIYLPAYLHYFLKSFNARSQFNFLGTTSTGLLNISAELLNNLRIPIVSMSEQRDTISRLREIEMDFEAKLDLVDRSISTLTEYKSSLITGAVTGTFDVYSGRDIA